MKPIIASYPTTYAEKLMMEEIAALKESMENVSYMLKGLTHDVRLLRRAHRTSVGRGEDPQSVPKEPEVPVEGTVGRKRLVKGSRRSLRISEETF